MSNSTVENVVKSAFLDMLPQDKAGLIIVRDMLHRRELETKNVESMKKINIMLDEINARLEKLG